MKIRHFLFGIVAFAVGTFLACLVGYATDTLQSDTPKQQAPMDTMPPALTTPATAKKKNCGCCTEHRARIQEKIQQERARRQVEQQVVNANSP